ncbi:MAG: peptidoglycan-associated lipoprotein Pal [Betaproteobacteria bacterium]|nr:peptidoglycan-associated lipoprotein Pal [Betaproteobacteria bacterium]
MMKRSLRAAIALSLAALLAACSTPTPLEEKGAPIESRGDSAGAGGAGAASAGIGDRSVRQLDVANDPSKDPLNDPNNPLSRRSIFFDFDSFVVKDEFRPILEAHARFLVSNPTRKVVLQGNTDDRGSREYNIALGQKRADAVRRAMVALGVAENQMEAVSFGEERPKNAGTDESALAENRRVDIAYQ